MKEKTNEEIIQINRDTLLDRMEASGGYHDQDQYPYGLMDEASKEIELLRRERDEARRMYCESGYSWESRAHISAHGLAKVQGWDCYKEGWDCFCKKEETP